MIMPPIFLAASLSQEVTDLIGSDPMRLFMFGVAPQSENRPYAVWQIISGNPQNYLNQRPDSEGVTIQIDSYAQTASLSADILSSIERAIELNCHVTAYRGTSFESDTKLYRTAMDVHWISLR